MDKNFENKYEQKFGEAISYVMENNVRNLGNLGVETGFTDLDRMTKGFQPSALTILAGRPAMGKTSFWLNAVRKMIKDPDMKVGVFLAKEESEKIANMILAMDSHVDIRNIETGRLGKKERERVEVSAAGIKETNIVITTPLVPYDNLEFQYLYYGILKYAQTYKLDIIIVDSLQNIKIDSECKKDKYIEIVKALRELAITCQIPIVLMSNLSEEIDSRREKRPILEDLRAYGYIEQYADTIILLYRDEYYNTDTDKKGIAELNVVKNTCGGHGIVELAWLPEFLTLANFDN